jgi:hypothetical protein
MGSFYQPKSYFKGGASYYQSKNYFKGGMKINTRKNNSSYTTRITKSKIDDLKKRLENIDLNSSKEEQYKKIDNILENIDTKNFNNEFNQKEIDILKTTILKMLNGKRGSKPSEFISVLEKLLERAKPKNGGFYPSVMSGVVGSGKYLFPAVLHQGYKLLNSKTRKSKKSKSLRKKHK